VEDAHDLRQDATDQQKIQWATTKLESALQSEWRAFADKRDLPRSRATWDHFLSYIRKEHVAPELVELDLREELFVLRQGADEDPMEFHKKWDTLIRRLETNEQLTVNEARNAFGFFRRLHFSMRKKLRDFNTPIDESTQVATAAQRLHMGHKRSHDDAFPTRGSPRPTKYQVASPRPGLESHSDSNQRRRSSHRGRSRSARGRDRNQTASGVSTPHRRDSVSTTSHGGGSAQNRHTGDAKALKCFNCGKTGHKAQDCHQKTTSSNTRNGVVQTIDERSRVDELSDSDSENE